MRTRVQRLSRALRPACSTVLLWGDIPHSAGLQFCTAPCADRSSYVDRILRGDKPSDLPVQSPTRFETTVKVRTAKALGFTFPPSLLLAADEIIE